MNFHQIVRELPKRRARPEDSLQMTLVELLRFTAKPGVVFFSVPNERKSNIANLTRLLKMGMRPGAHDLVFIIPPNGRTATLELKRDKSATSSKGVVSDEQAEFAADVIAAGGLTAVAYNFEQAVSTLKAWEVIR